VNQGHPVSALAFSPDGRFLASSSRRDPTVPIWEVATGREVGRFGPCGRGTALLAFSPDGTNLAIGSRSAIVVRHFPSGSPLRELKGSEAPLSFIAFSPDGQFLAAGNEDLRDT
jgi:WD40 repeat protein